ncbi:MAG TPA: glucose-6-phosphate isomerase family protein [Chloroflexota bacterium]|nr:glucose-6-phosphate isomerase family protein [Chloroflexota bacterium]
MPIELLAGVEVSYDPARHDVVLGPGVQAEAWRTRRAAEMRDVLPPEVSAEIDPDEPLYSMINGVYHTGDLAMASRSPLRYELTVLPPRRLGREYVKTLGHIHSPAPSGALTYAEVYEVLLGRAHFLFFRMHPDGEEVEEMVVVEAGPGDRVVVPPGYHHLSVNPGDEAMIFSDLIDRSAATDYSLLRARGGAPYVCVATATGPRYEPNPRYGSAPAPRHVRARDLPGHELLPRIPLYRMALDAPGALAFLSDPAPYTHLYEL